MGNCCRSEDPEQKRYNIEVAEKQQKIALGYNSNNLMSNSYNHLHNNILQKNVYNWHSIPITTPLHFKNKETFEVKNVGIKENNFVVGIIKKSAINLCLRMPWKTNYCICYESHEDEQTIGVIYEGQIIKGGKRILQQQTIKVIVTNSEIQFKSKDRSLAKRSIPADFISDQILPYVALFNEGDKVQFIGGIKRQKKVQKLQEA